SNPPGLCRSVSATSSAFASLAGWLALTAAIIPTALAGSNAMSEKRPVAAHGQVERVSARAIVLQRTAVQRGQQQMTL
ncbi:hypothetical protein, partial [Thermogemmatispora tikiterensis]|uniref:hypothetical protein n=1 Tax=Thermogemmatispora tikiterensis TaxID=1825093 RepID=UPI001CB8B2DA